MEFRKLGGYFLSSTSATSSISEGYGRLPESSERSFFVVKLLLISTNSDSRAMTLGAPYVERCGTACRVVMAVIILRCTFGRRRDRLRPGRLYSPCYQISLIAFSRRNVRHYRPDCNARTTCNGSPGPSTAFNCPLRDSTKRIAKSIVLILECNA